MATSVRRSDASIQAIAVRAASAVICRMEWLEPK
jgi:hypothetical protein